MFAKLHQENVLFSAQCYHSGSYVQVYFIITPGLSNSTVFAAQEVDNKWFLFAQYCCPRWPHERANRPVFREA